MADPEFLSGPPGPDAIELARIIDRGIRESEMIDVKKLCIRKGELVWTVFLDIYPINNDGNLIDAAALAAISALRSAVFPKLEGDKVLFGEFTKTKLPLTIIPITTTFGVVDGKVIADPGREEEKWLDCRLSVAVSEKGDVHALQKSGEAGLDIETVDEIIGLAIKKGAEIRKVLK